MRQIKFRGRTLPNTWFYGNLVQINDDYRIQFKDSITDVDSGKTIEFYRSVSVAPSTVGQFTGLLDRNGKEIYEGDILVYIDNEANEHYREVVYHCGCFKFHNPYAKLPDTPICNHLVDGKLNWEIIGNIHDQSKS